jgi:hypothetical protein
MMPVGSSDAGRTFGGAGQPPDTSATTINLVSGLLR